MYSLIIGVEVAIWLAGLVALWRLGFGRRAVVAPALAPWVVSVEGFALGTVFTIGGALALPYAVSHLSDTWLGPAARDCAWWEVVQAASFQLGLLGGLALATLYLRLTQTRPATGAAGTFPAQLAAPQLHPMLAGATVFLIAIPVINGIGLGWKAVVEALGFPTNEQDLVGLFRDCDDPARWVVMVLLATILAPLAEELVFRAGLFRFLRSRLPRGMALTIPAIVFALLHGNLVAVVPLAALGVFFALAYEKTGRISVPIIAHALFNLHTILLVMAGVTE